MEIIDHHKLGTLQTMQPISFRNQPVGCTGTIMYQMYGEQKLEIPPKSPDFSALRSFLIH